MENRLAARSRRNPADAHILLLKTAPVQGKWRFLEHAGGLPGVAILLDLGEILGAGDQFMKAR
jgi:hypothetical protein